MRTDLAADVGTRTSNPILKRDIDFTDDQLWMSVKDSGIGIEEHNLTKEFHRGFTTKDDGHGSGLTLALPLAYRQ
ncbi:hypothetical protein LOC67_14100 [Stieleria sp. JC731]|uniref:ATP-binding protein n=1 Tax=Pirellulaceae TaxID=2691357 RepID=UPI001E42D8AF|nr:ATP-binding protein [Stieleria sp. JC731]MCC9601687.1 hypothetical protein [Stieleria sp. JC731]